MFLRVHAKADGWHCEIEFSADKKSEIDAAFEWLASNGFEPAATAPAVTDNGSANGLPQTRICEDHGAEMKLREKSGDRWYSHKYLTPDGVEKWCRIDV